MYLLSKALSSFLSVVLVRPSAVSINRGRGRGLFLATGQKHELVSF